tara:strand:- start:1080 stop:1472 length:393 start_codon:yes stop_codon:yes gene_type:complete
LLTWVAVKEFSKKAWKFVVDQWLFFVAGVIGILGYIIGSRGSGKEVLDLRKKAEEEERSARQDAQRRTEEALRILDERMSELNEEQRQAVGELMKRNSEELEQKIIENREKPLDKVVGELASKYGLSKVE